MKNQEVINSINLEINIQTEKRDMLQKRLFDNFSFRFQWDAGTILYHNKMINILTDVVTADGSKDNKQEHMISYINLNTRMLLERDHCNKSTSQLANYQDEVERNVIQDVIRFFNDLLN